MNKVLTVLAAGLLAFVLAGCADPPQSTSAATTEPAPIEPVAAYRACLLTDEVPATPGSRNQQAIDGLARAQQQLGVETIQVAAAAADYPTALQNLVDQGCQLVVGAGPSLPEAISAAARANPQVSFALLDATPSSVPTNLRPIVFDTHEAAFLAGYLAASQSSSGKVGAFGGLPVPAVTIYLDGFVQGVTHYNQVTGGQVQVFGWNPDTQDGTFVRSTTSPWNDPAAGREAAASLVAQGADVILAVAEQSGVGALQLADQTGVRVLWSDSNGCLTQSEYCGQLLGSVVNDRAAAVYKLIDAAHQGRGAAGVFSANLRNEGTGLLPGAAGFTPELSAELDRLAKEIIDGRIRVSSSAAVG